MKKIYLLSFLLFISSVVLAARIESSKNGDWLEPGTWDLARVPSGGDEIYILANQTVTISEKTVVSGDAVILHIYGNLYFTQAGQLELPAGSEIYIYDGGDIAVEETNNNSTKLIIGNNNNQLSGSDLDAVTGPATLTEDNLSCGGCTPQPVNLLHFTATAQQNSVKIDWASSKAWDFSHYELERSADGKKFEYLASIDAEENTDWVVNYSFEDLQPLSSISYYRLKAVDIDGSFEYKGIEVVQLAAAISLKAYPNPSSNGSLNILTDHGADARVSLKDNSGRTVYAGTMQNAAKTIDTSSLQPGLYVLIVEGAGAARQTQVIIQ